MQTTQTQQAAQPARVTNEGPSAWKIGRPVYGMGEKYHNIEGFSTGTQMLHVSEQEAHLIAAARDLRVALQDLLAAMGAEGRANYPLATRRALLALDKSIGGAA